MRAGEGAGDHRYFPGARPHHFEISDECGLRKCEQNCQSQKNAVRACGADLGLSDYDASQLTANKVTSDFFEKAVALGGDAKQV